MNRVCVNGQQLIKAKTDGTIDIDRNLFFMAEEVNITTDADGNVCVSIKAKGYNPDEVNENS